MKRYFQSALRRVNGLNVASKRKELIQKYPELHEIFLKYISSFRGEGGYNYQMQDIKVLQLLDILVSKRPKQMVEYGTGSTSLAFAYYHDAHVRVDIIRERLSGRTRAWIVRWNRPSLIVSTTRVTA